MKEERNEKRKIVEMQKGVRYYIDENGNCVDIDIEDGIKTLIFDGSDYFDFDSLYGKKSFPDITELHIGRDVQYICIRNKVFPNVRKVTSDSPYFKSGDLLVSIPDYVVDMLKDGDVDEKYIKTSHSYVLQNVFCIQPDEIIDLSEIGSIQLLAFEDCLSCNIINSDNVTTCYDDCLLNLSHEDDKKNLIIGTILMKPYIEFDSDTYEFPDSKITAIYESSFADCLATSSNVECVVLKNTMQADALLNLRDLKITTIVFDINEKIDFSVIDCRTKDSKLVNLEVTKTNPYYKSIDGIVYSKDEKMLIKYCTNKKDKNVKIKDGVEEIDSKAFEWSDNIERIQLPETLRILKTGTFHHCKNINKVYIPESLEYMENACFDIPFYMMGCMRLKSRHLPKNFINALTSSPDGYVIVKNPYIAVHLIDKDDDPLDDIKDTHVLKRFYIPGLISDEKRQELNEYYNSHVLDDKYLSKMWKYCMKQNPNLSVKLAEKTFYYITDSDEELNKFIHDNGIEIAEYLIEYFSYAIRRMGEYPDNSIKQCALKRNFQLNKSAMLKLVDSSLLQSDALEKISDFISLMDMSSISEAVEKQLKK